MKNQFTSFHCLSVLFFFLSVNCLSQITYLGLKAESNIRQAQQELTAFGTYWPKSQLIDEYLYIPTKTGLFRKNLATTANDTIWQLAE